MKTVSKLRQLAWLAYNNDTKIIIILHDRKYVYEGQKKPVWMKISQF